MPPTSCEPGCGPTFTPAEIVEITYAIGTFIGYSKQIVTLGMEPEALAVTVVPTPGSGG